MQRTTDGGTDDPQILRRCALFAAADEATLDRVQARMRRRRFRRDEVIFHQGDPGDSLHVVLEGRVKIALPSPDGGEAIIATLDAGETFGELALLDGGPRSASAAAVEPTQTGVLARNTFLGLVAEDVGVRDALLVSVARQLRRVTGQVEELHFLDLPGRLAMRLARLADDAGVQDDRATLDWPWTQTDLAGMIGGTRQSVNRLLQDLAAEGLVIVEQDRLVIPSVERLRRAADR